MVLIHWSKGVFSGEALEAVLRVLSEHLESAPGRAEAGAAGAARI